MVKKPKQTSKLKNSKLFQNYLRTVEQYVLGRNYVPMSSKELLEKLSIMSAHAEIIDTVLEELLHTNTLKTFKGRYFPAHETEDVVSGIIRMHPRGFGFVQAANPIDYPQDIFIPKHLTKNAVDGDGVEVMVNPNSLSEKGPEGKVVAITTRGRTHLAGTVSQIMGKTPFVYVPLLGSDQRVVIRDLQDETLNVGDRIVGSVGVGHRAGGYGMPLVAQNRSHL